jgi:hypothetical protein
MTKGNHGAAEFLGNHETVRDLAGIAGTPEVCDVFWRGLPLHDLHDVRHGDCPGIGKTILERRDAREMIAMAVRDIDVGQVFTTCGNPVGEGGSDR